MSSSPSPPTRSSSTSATRLKAFCPAPPSTTTPKCVKPGDTFPVSVTGRNEEHYYELSRFKVAQPRDWSALEAAFAEKTAVVGTVTEVIKGGVRVDIGVRAFMPASRSGTKDAAELEKLVGTEINCRITKLDITDEDVVVDRRVVLEEQARGLTAARREAMKEGDIVTGTVRTLMPYGAFVDLGGIDGLLHISDISHARVAKPEDVLTVGQELQLNILKIDPETKKISLGLKQLQAEPWQTVSARSPASASPAPSPASWTSAHLSRSSPASKASSTSRKCPTAKSSATPPTCSSRATASMPSFSASSPKSAASPSASSRPSPTPGPRSQRNFPVGSQIEGPVTKLMNFGAFVQIADGIEGLVHISEITADRRLNHPSDVLRAGQIVKAQVLAIDPEKRQIKLSMKQLIPTEIDEYIAEHKVGDKVSGRVVEQSPTLTHVELGDGIRATCRTTFGSATMPSSPPHRSSAPAPAQRASSQARPLQPLLACSKPAGKGNTPAPPSKPEPLSRRPDPHLQNHQAGPRSQKDRSGVGVVVLRFAGYPHYRVGLNPTGLEANPCAQQSNSASPFHTRWPRWSAPGSSPANMPRRARLSILMF